MTIVRTFRASMCVFAAAITCLSSVSSAGAAEKDEPSYYLIPLVGRIDTGTATAFEECVAMARKLKAQHVVVSLDATGAEAEPVRKIVQSISAASESVKFVAVVRQAPWTSGFIPLACPTVLMTPSATIGGAPTAVLAAGAPKPDVPAARGQGQVVESAIRGAVTAAGHDPLLSRGIVEKDLVLGVGRDKSGAATLVEGKPDGGRVLKEKGRILVLTADDAVELKLCNGTVPEQVKGKPSTLEADVGAALGLGSWRKAGTGENIIRKARVASVNASFEPRLKKADDEIETLRRRESQLQAQIGEMEARARENKNLNRPRRAREDENKADDLGKDLRKVQNQIIEAQREKEKVLEERRDALAELGKGR